jgi:universal stress protein E
MNKFEKIVVGLELNPECTEVTLGSRKAALQALWVAKANGGSIHFVHSSYDDKHRESAGECGGPTGPPEDGVKALEELVEEIREAGIEAKIHYCQDRVWMEITRMALRDRADLVIVGKRNVSRESGRRLGTVAIKLLRKCPCPVWVVRPAHDLVHRLVLAATDLSPVGDLAVRYGAYLSERHNCNLHVVHAWQMPIALQMRAHRLEEGEFTEAIDEIKKKCAAQIESNLTEYKCTDGLTIHSSKGAPSQVIREAVAHLDPDILVMGSISRAGIAGVLLGSTAERLLDRVDCSILAVKPDDFVSPVTLG